jgi:prepilin-type N-terminal cleavage/methylation domain-containing protein
MSTSSRKAFTLVELIVVIVVIMILTTIGIWNIVQLRQDAQSVATSDALATVQRMQELANMEGLSQTNTDATLRIMELQAGLASTGNANFKINPQVMGAQLTFSVDSSGATHWQNVAP